MAGRVYLVRHADAAPRTTTDAARPLTPAGRTRFEAHARALAPSLGLAAVLTSPLERARETAALLAAATASPVDEEPALASGASTGRALLALARRVSPGTALVGHNPEIAEAVALAAGRELAVPPGAVAALEIAPDGAIALAWLRAPSA
ncbi:histidine phosphatase family protein [Anaeromyxobacter sp. SG64]|uniref:SixA phosphatase family protein n=1 Tax=Anaeromyxobacter sp. SG64 TaxID=2925409 RepID=UPI001F55D6DF|nr:phosphoglycerate mutase family protein [Anaeromyxobacter sp. SG64]